MTHKYRAWDKKWNRWIEPKDICVYGDGTADFVRRAENGDKIEIVELKSGEIELEQSTGKKDKNGKDSCDGDIISYPNDYPAGEYEPSEPNNDIGEIYWDNDEAAFLVKSNSTAREQIDMPLGQFVDEYGEFEIIGNIHTPPELKEN